MPTYEYVCTACAERSEVVQSFTDASLTECRSCGGRLRKVFSPVGVVFKGSGFYKTDSREKSSASSTAKSESGATSSSGDTGGDTGASAKPEAKSAAGTKTDGAASTTPSATPSPSSSATTG